MSDITGHQKQSAALHNILSSHLTQPQKSLVHTNELKTNYQTQFNCP